jgi:hypothetical protein
VFDVDAVDELLNTYVRGLELAISEGVSAPEPNFRGYKVINENQIGMDWA